MDKLDVEEIKLVIDELYAAYERGSTIFTMGNGGSAATASHFICDMSKGAISPGKKRIKAISLSDNMALITAWANDTNYTNVFGEQLINLCKPGDVLLGLTASGMSPNIINAFLVGNEHGLKTIAVVGFNGGTVRQVAQHCLLIPSENIQQIEDVQVLLLHLISSLIRDKIKAEGVAL